MTSFVLAMFLAGQLYGFYSPEGSVVLFPSKKLCEAAKAVQIEVVPKAIGGQEVELRCIETPPSV